jgi:DNA-directed RNA polymerase subunit K/omega
MSDIKSKAQGLDPNVQPRDIGELVDKTGNVYESIAIISKRARQISSDLKWEIQRKLEEFAVSSDTIEEVQENKEQIEISKFYERLPNTPIIAAHEFLHDELQWRMLDERVRD